MNWDKVQSLLSSLGALIAAIVSVYNSFKIKSVHLLVNSRLTQLLNLTRTSSFSEGEKSEKDKHDSP
jgi:hypothetical protein